MSEDRSNAHLSPLLHDPGRRLAVRQASSRWRRIARTGVAVALAVPLFAAASAQATWTAVAPVRDHHCGAAVAAPHVTGVAIQGCVIVHDTPSGAYVQAAVKVTNLNDDPRRRVRPTGYARLFLEGKAYRNDNCGPVTIAGGQAQWCYGKTMLILGHGRDVSATGYAWSGAGTHDAVNSPHWKISPTAPIQDARTKIVSILLREASNPAHNREVGGPNCNFYSAALGVGGGGCPPGYRKQLWCADFGRWVWGQAGVNTRYLSASAMSFKTYGERMRTWHAGSSLSGIKPGDAVVLRRNGGGHVAFVIAVHGNRSVSAIGGNSSDKVETVVYRPGHSRMVGFASPAA